MGTDYVADIPGNLFPHSMSYASLASNGADRVLPFFPSGFPVQVVSAWIVPNTSQAGSATNYADVKIVNLGTGSAGTTVLANKAFSATGASVDANSQGSMALGATVSKASGEHLGVSHEQVANGIDLVAHTVHMLYRRL